MHAILRLSSDGVARTPRNEPYTPGRDARLDYTIELLAADYPLGTTIISALLVAEASFGLAPLITKAITSSASANGQITDTGADGLGALYFALTSAELNQLSTAPVGFEVIVTDSLGRQATLDLGSLVPGFSTAGKPVDHVVVAPKIFSVQDPGTAQLTATAYDVDGLPLVGRVVLWNSSDPSVATIDATTGLVTGVGAGNVLFTASIEGKTDTATGSFTTNVTTVGVAPNPITARVGTTAQLTATPRDIGGNVVPNQTFVWTSSDPTIATVDQAGLVTPVAQGTVTITATVSGTTVSGNTVFTAAPAADGSIADERYSITDADIGAWAEENINQTIVGGKVTQLADVRGAVGFGPVLNLAGSAGPTYDAANDRINVGGFSDQTMKWGPSLQFDMTKHAYWLAIVCSAELASGNPLFGLSDGSGSFGLTAQQFFFMDTGGPQVYDLGGFHNPYGVSPSATLYSTSRPPVASDNTQLRLFFIEKYTMVASDQGVLDGFVRGQVYGAPAVFRFNGSPLPNDFAATTPPAAMVVELMHMAGFSAIGGKFKWAMYGTGILSGARRQALWRRAQLKGALRHQTSNAVAAVPTKIITVSHDSNGQGYGTSNPDTDAWPVVLAGLLGSTWYIQQGGYAGLTAVDLNAYAPYLVEPMINMSVQTKHIHIVGPDGTNDLFGTYPGAPRSASSIIAARQARCQLAKAAGAQVLLMTTARTTSDNETNNATMATINAWARGAVAAGYADRLYDLYAFGTPTGGNHFDTAQNAAIAAAVQAIVVTM